MGLTDPTFRDYEPHKLVSRHVISRNTTLSCSDISGVLFQYMMAVHQMRMAEATLR